MTELSITAQHWVAVVLIWVGLGSLAGLLARIVLPVREPSGPLPTLTLGITGTAVGLGVLSWSCAAIISIPSARWASWPRRPPPWSCWCSTAWCGWAPNAKRARSGRWQTARGFRAADRGRRCGGKGLGIRANAASFDHGLLEEACDYRSAFQARFNVVAQVFLLVSPKGAAYVCQTRTNLLDVRGNDGVGFIEGLGELVRKRRLRA